MDPRLVMWPLSYDEEFFNSDYYKVTWGDLTGKTAMDLGCGSGQTSTRCFIEMHPNVKRLIAVDNSENAIRYARKESKHPKITYHCADILRWATMCHWEGEIDVIVSFLCFNYFDNKMPAFQNVYKLLAPGGMAVLVFTLKADIYDYSKEVRETYRRYLPPNLNLITPESHTNNRFAFEYRSDLEQLGFQIITCTDVYHNRIFVTDQECKDHLAGINAMLQFIPQHLVHAFKEELFTSLLNIRNRIQGHPRTQFRTAKLVVKKTP